MELTEEQSIARDKIVDWYNNSDQQVFFLSGFAGTGKTFLITYILQNELNIDENDYAFCAPTGKAATVLILKGSDATTIHRLIYSPVETENKIVDPESGNVIIKKDVKFIKKQEINKKLIIVDEFSMVDYQIFADLCSYGIKILAVGDIGQLPPVKKSNNSQEAAALDNVLKKPDAQLTKILRQNEGNYILRIAELARCGMYIQSGSYNGDVIVYDKETLNEDQLLYLYMNADQVIAGKNATIKDINNKMRKAYGHTSQYPEVGEKIICLQNNYDIELNDKFSLTNGIIGICGKYTKLKSTHNLGSINFVPNLTDEEIENIICDPYDFTYEKSEYDTFQQIYRLPGKVYEPKTEIRKRLPNESFAEYQKAIKPMWTWRTKAIDILKLNKFTFGYCITCHKSQGSEWDTVVVVDESRSFGADKNKWLYTAITRAKKKCIIIR